MQFHVLGPLAVVRNGAGLPLGSTKQQALLACLLLRANQPTPMADLVDALWGMAPPASAVKNVQLYVSRLRRTLGPGGEERIRTAHGGYSLAVGPGELDLDRCRALAAEAQLARRSGAPERARTLLREALGLWRGGPLPRLAGTVWLEGEIRSLEEMRLMLHEDYFQVLLDTGRHREAVPELKRMVIAHPMQERFRFQLMLALSRAGDRSAALAVYRSGYQLLVNTLGIEPCRELRNLHDSILADTAVTSPRPLRRAPGPLAAGAQRAVPVAL
ncbi:BTAD domain-containing putative transcriptional regulator [Streptomyces sp. NPDC059070]|uniref:AfsR/SARP family transcriptional regulator n=1 Tax=unclassified Streptomyces TaxID=2593676 RepID=UPI0034E1FF56